MASPSSSVILAFVCVVGPVLSAEPVSLAVPMSLQPHYIPHTDQGLSYETLEAAFRAHGRKVLPIYVSEKQNEGILDRHSTVDCAGLQSEADSKNWFAVDEVYPLRDQVVTLATNDLKISEVADLSGKTVIGYVGARAQLGAELRKALEGSPNYREINNHLAQVRLLLKNRVQAIIADKLLVEWYFDYLAEEPGHWEKVVFHDLFPPSRLKIACRGQALAEDLTAGLKEIESSGELAAIRSRYLQ